MKRNILFSCMIALTLPMLTGCADEPIVQPTHQLDSEVLSAGAESELDEGSPSQVTPGMQIVVYKDAVRMVLSTPLLFHLGTTELSKSGRQMLDQVYTQIESFTGPSVTVTGYTDDVGDPVDLHKQAYKEAESVSAYLWTRGVAWSTIKIVSAGPKDPVSSNRTVQGKTDNRRVEVWLH